MCIKICICTTICNCTKIWILHDTTSVLEQTAAYLIVIIGNVDRLRFHGGDDGFMGYITVWTTSGKEDFSCINCHPDSQETSLNLLHLNIDGNASDVFQSTSCTGSCDFYKERTLEMKWSQMRPKIVDFPKFFRDFPKM